MDNTINWTSQKYKYVQIIIILRVVVSVIIIVSAAAANYDLTNIIDDEIEALLEVRKSVQDPKGHLESWVVPAAAAARALNYSTTPCSWKGVLCEVHDHRQSSSRTYRVISLSLAHMNLSGTISPKIGRLQKLVNVSLAANNLSGVVPGELCEMGGSLRYLNISNNLLAGSFPADNLSNLASLEVLDAYNNLLDGALPLQLSKLRRMRHLHLGGNFFNGSIPPEYGGMHSLVYLGLSGNLLTGRIPVQLGNLVLLEELYLGYYNQFEGGIPASLGCLTNLVILDLAQCALNGTIPPRLLRNLTNLHSLFLYTNSLSGSIPPETGNLLSLKFLDLSDNRLSGHIPQQLSKLVNLEILHLFRNQITGSVPSFIGDLPTLHDLSLWQNNMVGSLPKRLGSNGKLLTVDLSSNSFTGPLPLGLCSGDRLQVLVLFDNLFTGPIPESLANCTALKRIRLGQNSLSGSIPLGLLALPWLQMMEMPSNNLSGSVLLDELSTENYQLGLLDLSRNQLSGFIPPSIGNLVALQALLLNNNALNGSIPAGMRRLKRLSKLDLSGNSIRGVIPAALGDCVDLTYLDLSRNQLEDGIPEELRNLNVLNFLNLSRNHLTGNIPSSLQLMQTLTSADFSYNNLSGAIPAGGQFAAFNASSFVGNAALCGAQLQIACFASSSANLSSFDKILHKIQGEPAVVYWAVVGIMSSLTVVVLLLGVYCNYWHSMCVFLKQNDIPIHNRSSAWKLTAFQKLDFTANHILASLTEENVIGKGGSGTVYRCATPSGYVAVKRLPSATSGSLTGSSKVVQSKIGAAAAAVKDQDNEVKCQAHGGRDHDHDHDHGFSAEIETLGKIRHRNIVRLLGCCSSRDTNLLIYEYMPNGSVGELLHGPRGGSLLDWGKRYRIAVDAANGLRYLHHDCSPLIVHRDVKSNNILLDSKFEAHVSDFGLAKPLNNINPESMSSIAGSYGYIAPEYVYTLQVDEKSDIYSFGIVLLELLTGRRPLEPEYGEGVDIAQWVRSKYLYADQSEQLGAVMQFLDPRLHPPLLTSPVTAHQVMLLLRVAFLCLAHLPVHRPTMQHVVHLLSSSSTSRALPFSIPL